jgi:hypothetical protein
MNRYGAMMQRHWQRWLPEPYVEIRDPDSFFAVLGELVAQQVDELADDLAGDDLPGEGYLAKAGRLSAARRQAEEIILPELVLLPPAREEDEGHHEDDTPATAQARPLVIGRGHPSWPETDAEQRERIGPPAEGEDLS